MEYFSIKKAIPRQWLEKLNENNRSSSLISLDLSDGDSINTQPLNELIFYEKSNLYYKMLITKMEFCPTGPHSLARDLNTTPDVIIDSFINVRALTKSSKFIILQYKIIHRIIACNAYLHQTRIKESDKCSYCDQSDSIKHFFFDCENTRRFWNTIEIWLNNITSSSEIIDLNSVILGYDTNNPTLAIVILFGKWFIYKAKLIDSPLDLNKFKIFLKYQSLIEKQALIINYSIKKEKKFKSLWNKIEGNI